MRKILIIFVVITIFTFFEINKWAAQSGPLTESRLFVITSGESLRGISKKLKDAGIIRSSLIFILKARVTGLDGRLQAGEYEFLANSSINNVLQKIARGEVFYHQLTIPEGYTTGQILYMVENNSYLGGEISIDIAEGELLPETYSFVLGMQKDNLLLVMKQNMTKALSEAWASRTENKYIKTPEHALVLASIIEKETGINDERALIASVFINRLKKGMRLQTDPSVIYAITKGEFEFGRALTRSDLSYDSPYNTYRVYGLPPSPICNPGKKSLEAALNASESEYLYFVADGKGGHNFSKSLEEHNENVRNWKKR